MVRLHAQEVPQQTSLWESADSNPCLVAFQELPVVSPDEFEQHVEVLARLEHTAWMNERLETGWSYAPGEKSLEQRTHPCLVSWEQLPEAEKEKDRQQMRAVPAILSEAGLRLALQPSTTPLLAEYAPSLL